MVRQPFALTAVFLASSAVAQAPDATEWKWSAGNLSVEAGIETYTSYYAMNGTWWNLAAAPERRHAAYGRQMIARRDVCLASTVN
jgi:hypothetical protein